jgi:hypothetical protein
MQASKELEICSPPVTKPELTYRSDIDGLRAVAVLLVFAFHLQAFKIMGGFVGVDVFFVISGFLISSVILRDIEESRFSLAAFYERRIRRIIPALVVMMFVTTLFCAFYQLPAQVEDTAKSLLAATYSVSNIYFLLTTNYFSTSDAKPFLPTWSLAVEEQFYIFFPLFLLLIRRMFPGRLKTAILGVVRRECMERIRISHRNVLSSLRAGVGVVTWNDAGVGCLSPYRVRCRAEPDCGRRIDRYPGLRLFLLG